MEYVFIVNPVAGRGAGARSLSVIQDRMEKQGGSYRIFRTEHPGHGIDLARQAVETGCGIVVAVGGDGTANEVLNGLMQIRRPQRAVPAMGVLCVGRGNDFAFGAGIPTRLEDGFSVLFEGEKRIIDLGLVHVDGGSEGRYFGNGVGVGFDTVVGFEARKMKVLHGFLSYFVAALKTLFIYFKPPEVRIEMNGENRVQSALMVSIMNGRRMGGGFMMAPSAGMDDGRLDICIASRVGRLRVLSLIVHFMKGTQEGQDPIRMERTERLCVIAERGVLPAHADGETLCEAGSRLEVEIVPRALTLITASKGSEDG